MVVATCSTCGLKYTASAEDENYFAKRPSVGLIDNGKTLVETRLCYCGTKIHASKGASLHPR